MRFRHLAALAVLAAARPAAAQFNPIGSYTLRMQVPGDTAGIPIRIVIADSAGRLGGTYQNTSGTLVRQIIAVVVQPGPQVIIQIDRGETISTLLMRVRGSDITGEGDFDGEVFTLTGKKN